MLIGWLTNALFGEKIERFNISQFYVINNAHRVQMIIDIAEITTKELLFAIQPLSRCQYDTVFMIKTSLATTNARSAIT